MDQDEFNFCPTFINPIPIEVQLIHKNAKLPTKGEPSKNDHIVAEESIHIFNLGYDIHVVEDDEWNYSGGEARIISRWSRVKITTPFFELAPRQSKTFSTGIKVKTPPNYGFLLRDRSGLGVKDVTITAGVIEGTYRGEWKIHIINHSPTSKIFNVGDRIAQAILIPIIPSTISLANVLGDTTRSSRGFGSSGK